MGKLEKKMNAISNEMYDKARDLYEDLAGKTSSTGYEASEGITRVDFIKAYNEYTGFDFSSYEEEKISDLINKFSSFGDYYTVKNKNYDDVVGAIINIGEESTNVSVFNKGIQIKNSLIPVGSKNVDKDLTYVFKSNLEESRKLKEKFAVALSSLADSNDTWNFKIDKDTSKEVNQVGVSKVVEARVRELLKLAKNEIKNLTNREIRYIIITGGLSELAGFSYLVEQEFGFVAKVCNIKTMGIRHNMYSSCYGTIKYFNDKLDLRGKHYNMISNEDVEKLSSTDSLVTTSENVISKVFGHFFVD